MVSVVRMISQDDVHSENIWLSWSKASSYQEKLRCHACDGRTDTEVLSGKQTMQYSGRPETATTVTSPPKHRYFIFSILGFS